MRNPVVYFLQYICIFCNNKNLHLSSILSPKPQQYSAIKRLSTHAPEFLLCHNYMFKKFEIVFSKNKS